MRLTTFTDFGLRMLMHMAAEPGRAFSSADFARELGLSRNHLAKILQRLAAGGVIVTRRGSGGGALLARPAEALRLGAIVRLLDSDQPLVECFGAGEMRCTIGARCRLKGRLRQAEAAFMADLDRATLADIAVPLAEGAAA